MLSEHKSQARCEIDYVLYALNTHSESYEADLTLAFDKLKVKAGNAIILYPDPKNRSCSSSGSCKYKARIIQHGHWVKDNKQAIVEVSMGECIIDQQHLQNSGLLTPKSIPNYAELINEALARANLNVPENIKHRTLMKYRNKPETRAWLKTLALAELEEKKDVDEQMTPISEADLHRIIRQLAENQNEPELTEVIEEHLFVNVCPNRFTPCGQLAFENKQDAMNFLINKFPETLSGAVYGAAAAGHENLVDELLARGASIKTAVIGAAEAGNIELVEYLIARGAKLDDAIYGAASGRKRKLVNNLIIRGVRLHMAVEGAVKSGDIELIDELLARDAAILNLNHALYGAGVSGDIEMITKFLDHGACLDAMQSGKVSDDRYTEWLEKNRKFRLTCAVAGAALSGHIELVDDLISRGACKNKAVEQAALGAHKQLVERLLAQGASVSDAAYGAGFGQHVKAVKYLIAKGRFLPEVEEIALWAVRGAAAGGNLDLVNYILGQRDSVNLVYGAFEYAASLGHVKLTKYLINTMPRDFFQDMSIAVKCAAMNGERRLVEYLMKKRKRNEYACISKEEAIYGAAYAGNMKFVEYLLAQRDWDYFDYDKQLWAAVRGARYYLQDEKSTLFTLSECQSEKFRKRFLLEARVTNGLGFNPNVDLLLIKAKKIFACKQQAHLSFNESIACFQPDIHGLFSFISQIAHDNYLNKDSWLIIATYLYPLLEIEAKRIRLVIKRENVLHDVNVYYSSLGRFSYFSSAATKTRAFMEECKKANSEKRLCEVIEKTDEQLSKVFSKYRP